MAVKFTGKISGRAPLGLLLGFCLLCVDCTITLRSCLSWLFAPLGGPDGGQPRRFSVARPLFVNKRPPFSVGALQLAAMICDSAPNVAAIESADLVRKYRMYAEFCDEEVAQADEGWTKRVYKFKSELVKEAAWRAPPSQSLRPIVAVSPRF
jgi:hypothetical protein